MSLCQVNFFVRDLLDSLEHYLPRHWETVYEAKKIFYLVLKFTGQKTGIQSFRLLALKLTIFQALKTAILLYYGVNKLEEVYTPYSELQV